MDRLNHINPFARRDSHSANSVITYKVLTLFTWLLSVISTTYYYHRRPYDDLLHDTIPDINYGISTPFRLFIGLVAIYWLVLYILQLVYISHLFSTKVESVNAACAVGSHFIVYNLFHFAFVMLFVRHHFFLAELMLVINFFNLTFLYFRHNDYPRFIHLPAVSGPLAWTFVALYWDGAIIFAPHSGHLVGRIFAYIFVWSFLGYGLFFLAIYKDYTMGFCMGVLSLALAIGQQYRSHFYFQSFFAFAIMGVLLLYSSVLALYAWSGREAPWWRRGNDSERAPLLAEP